MAQAVLDLGVEVIHWIETHRTPPLDLFFLVVTDFGSTIGYLVLLPLIWWGLSWKVGVRLLVVLVLSIYINASLKELFAVPRPFVYADVCNLRSPNEFSFPSGHAQSAAVVWGLLALHLRRKWFSATAAAVIFLIGLSRIYLGVHFPSDVLAGWVLGGTLAWLFARWSKPVVGWAASLPLGTQLLLSVALPALLTVLHGTRNTSMALGGLAGALGGLAFAYHRGLYPSGGQSRSRRAWLLVGLVGLPVLYLSLRGLSPAETSRYYQLYLWARFAAIGLWASFLVPRITAHVKSRGGSGENSSTSTPREI